MTAEIALLNKQAVALAADSAVTVNLKTGKKIFLSANKIFTLSKYHPIAIMIWNSADFMDIPWETIIKIFRKKLGRTKFNYLEDYANEFVKFLINEKLFDDDKNEKEYVRQYLSLGLAFIWGKIKENVDLSIQKRKRVSKTEIKKIRDSVINQYVALWNKQAQLPDYSKEFKNIFLTKYESIIDEVILEFAKELPITLLQKKELKKLCIQLFSKYPPDENLPWMSGVVIAGFGDLDIFPKLTSYLMCGKVCGLLKYRSQKNVKIDYNNRSAIIPFAQGEMVYNFMEGVNPEYDRKIKEDIRELVTEYPKIILDAIQDLSGDLKQQYLERFKQIGKDKFRDYSKRLDQFRFTYFVTPIISIVSNLPKNELSNMAESLVNLTSLKRKVSTEEETVGGPIDVAVISKGDGFIWIKRKHYFSPDLNPNFSFNYQLEG